MAGRLGVVVLGLALVATACAGGVDVDPPGVGVGVDVASAAMPPDDRIEIGRQLAAERNCHSCHSVDGSRGVGPSWRGLVGSTERLTDGSTVTVDPAYLARSIVDPQAQVVAGFDVVDMPTVDLTPEEVDALVAYIVALP